MTLFLLYPSKQKTCVLWPASTSHCSCKMGVVAVVNKIKFLHLNNEHLIVPCATFSEDLGARNDVYVTTMFSVNFCFDNVAEVYFVTWCPFPVFNPPVARQIVVELFKKKKKKRTPTPSCSPLLIWCKLGVGTMSV